MKTVSITFDLALDDERVPERGHVLTSARCTYRVLDARPVDSAKWGNRWRITLTRIDPASADPRAHVWRSRRYEPGETPESYFGRAA